MFYFLFAQTAAEQASGSSGRCAEDRSALLWHLRGQLALPGSHGWLHTTHINLTSVPHVIHLLGKIFFPHRFPHRSSSSFCCIDPSSGERDTSLGDPTTFHLPLPPASPALSPCTSGAPCWCSRGSLPCGWSQLLETSSTAGSPSTRSCWLESTTSWRFAISHLTCRDLIPVSLQWCFLLFHPKSGGKK